ncbi:GH23756 [Drosophila grimshawi]|uniref:GH23756 n=1 Tax=Drosophila grimshawi TaxID=7222 RepID=B4JZY5_DROGR|nr:GH23756 [Drosophila grimshawi]
MALEALMELTPLHHIIRLKQKATLVRISAEGVGGNHILSHKDAQLLSYELPLLTQPRDEMAAEYIFERNFTVRMSSKREWTTLDEVHPMKPHTIKWYTDGSLTNQGTGLGVVGPRVFYHESLGTHTSIFQAESRECANPRREWSALIKKESQALEALVDLPEGKSAIGCKWVSGVKIGKYGYEERNTLTKRVAELTERISSIEKSCSRCSAARS